MAGGLHTQPRPPAHAASAFARLPPSTRCASVAPPPACEARPTLPTSHCRPPSSRTCLLPSPGRLPSPRRCLPPGPGRFPFPRPPSSRPRPPRLPRLLPRPAAARAAARAAAFAAFLVADRPSSCQIAATAPRERAATPLRPRSPPLAHHALGPRERIAGQVGREAAAFAANERSQRFHASIAARRDVSTSRGGARRSGETGGRGAAVAERACGRAAPLGFARPPPSVPLPVLRASRDDALRLLRPADDRQTCPLHWLGALRPRRWWRGCRPAAWRSGRRP